MPARRKPHDARRWVAHRCSPETTKLLHEICDKQSEREGKKISVREAFDRSVAHYHRSFVASLSR
jgi:hypothetical protein